MGLSPFRVRLMRTDAYLYNTFARKPLTRGGQCIVSLEIIFVTDGKSKLLRKLSIHLCALPLVVNLQRCFLHKGT